VVVDVGAMVDAELSVVSEELSDANSWSDDGSADPPSTESAVKISDGGE